MNYIENLLKNKVMKQEDKDTLLKYLCMALPYGVKCHFKYGSAEDDITLSCIDNNVARFKYGWYGTFHVSIDADYIKPYLRPMSSMTEEEDEKWWAFSNEQTIVEEHVASIQYLLENHIDFMGLISKGLALEAPEGMYMKEE